MVTRKGGALAAGDGAGQYRGAHARPPQAPEDDAGAAFGPDRHFGFPRFRASRNTRLGLSIDKVEKLARALGVTPETFVSRERPGRAPPSSARSQAANPGEARFLVDRAAERQANAYRELTSSICSTAVRSGRWTACT
jgi:hypothetical protein